MSAKVAKVSKTSTKTVPAKAVSKVEKTTEKPAPVKSVKSTKSASTTVKSVKSSVRLSEEDKKADKDTYILNPSTDKYVKRTTPLGKKLVNAEKNGEEVPKTMSETERLIFLVQTIVDQCGLEDSEIKDALKPIANNLPRGFPVIWGGKQKTARSPDHPKQPSNAYIFFTKAVRRSVVESNPELSNTAVVSLMAKMWKDTTEDDRTEYNQLAAEDKERYESEMKEFEAEHPDQARAKSSPGKPTKATAYHKYCEENREIVREENPELDGKSITKILIEQWEDIKKDDTEFKKYQQLANEANKGFADRVTEYHENNSPKKLSETEQAKADDPEHYELNPKTGRYVRKEEKKIVEKPVEKVVEKPVEKVIKPKAKAKAKTVAEEIKNDEIEENNDEIEQIKENNDEVLLV